ncbi:Membrane protease YdiL, CAAX protease family [Saccharopolyspora antimicrobica]|uniref:Membrane protease YdiL (CAAX protease family) n=1 Tax=Saccharopolyspora antimicrobica TaxID=455193 RepID=A0A1I4ZPP6_9PSEU|nr:type II CAAX endopeptidase family protein [Saccharopolyspora antimicrobica]RKT83447.1 membrane protease YdiL (CAAX protease family) [Saccharopolyspora antimicrobica]SFN52245.1 Membrane protease YdiL, CAAX protease family [Saccharopolyspora antimicrobica]
MTTESPARQKSGIFLFLVVTFATAWASWGVAILLGGPAMSSPTVIPYLLGAFGPMFGAIVIRLRRAARRQPAPAHSVRLPLIGLLWTPVLLAVAAGTVVGAALLAQQLGGPPVSPTAAQTLLEMSGGPLVFAAVMLVVGPLSEEFGWRGTLHPRLRGKMGRLFAGLLLGIIWSIWHLPLFFVTGTVQNAFGLLTFSGLTYLLSVIPMALLAAYAYDRAGVLGAVAIHFGANATMSLVGVTELLPQALIVAVQAVVALLLLAVHRDRRKATTPELAHRELVPTHR